MKPLRYLTPLSRAEYDCPECTKQCELCSDYLLTARAIGCGMQWGERRCEKGRAAKGTVCPICDNTGYVPARIEPLTNPPQVKR